MNSMKWIVIIYTWDTNIRNSNSTSLFPDGWQSNIQFYQATLIFLHGLLLSNLVDCIQSTSLSYHERKQTNKKHQTKPPTSFLMSEARQPQENVWWQNDLWKSNLFLRQAELRGKCYTPLVCPCKEQKREVEKGCCPSSYLWCVVEENTSF